VGAASSDRIGERVRRRAGERGARSAVAHERTPPRP
jgi:hypothetical protein